VAEDTDNVIISDHAFDRSDERFDPATFTSVDVYWILETGTSKGSQPKRTAENGRLSLLNACQAQERRVSSL